MLNLQCKLSLAAACVAFGTLGLATNAQAQNAGGIVGVASFILDGDGFVVQASAGSAIGATTAAGIAGTETIVVDDGDEENFLEKIGMNGTTRALVLGTGANLEATVVTANEIGVPTSILGGGNGNFKVTGPLFVDLNTTGAAGDFEPGINNQLGQESQTPLIPNLPNFNDLGEPTPPFL